MNKEKESSIQFGNNDVLKLEYSFVIINLELFSQFVNTLRLELLVIFVDEKF